MIKIFHLKSLTEEQRKRLNNPETGGWDSEPEFTRYANITMQANPDDIVTALIEGEYKLAGVVDSNDLDIAWQLTNHIDRDWGENDGVTQLPGRQRSTSVGDLMVHVETGVTSIVDSFGFNVLGAGA